MLPSLGFLLTNVFSLDTEDRAYSPDKTSWQGQAARSLPMRIFAETLE